MSVSQKKKKKKLLFCECNILWGLYNFFIINYYKLIYLVVNSHVVVWNMNQQSHDPSCGICCNKPESIHYWPLNCFGSFLLRGISGLCLEESSKNAETMSKSFFLLFKQILVTWVMGSDFLGDLKCLEQILSWENSGPAKENPGWCCWLPWRVP